MKKILLSTLVILGSGMLSQHTWAQLSPKALFVRCYKQITQSYPANNHPGMSSTTTQAAIDACLNVLDKARFTANGNKRIGNTNDQEALNVLKTMHAVHHSWLTNKTFPLGGLGYLNETKDLLDYNGVALYYTRALFAPNYQFQNIFRGSSEHLQSDRTNNSPDRAPISNRQKSNYPYGNNTVFAPKGTLRGVTTYTQKRFNFVDDNDRNQTTRFDEHWGAGVLGSHIYVTMNADVTTNFRANGTILTHRKWSRNLVQDFLCREFPVIRYSDAQPYVRTDSPIAFRNEVGCVACHVTLDQSAALIRTANGVRHRNSGSRIIETYRKHAISQGSADVFPASNDGNFYRRPAEGRFVFRTHDGQLINEDLDNLEQLGTLFGQIDAPYVCAAKRYYQYFTGIKANVDDIADPQYPNSLSANELAHRNEVIQLGMQLKQHQSLRRLVEDILKKPQFQNAGYNITN